LAVQDGLEVLDPEGGLCLLGRQGHQAASSSGSTWSGRWYREIASGSPTHSGMNGQPPQSEQRLVSAVVVAAAARLAQHVSPRPQVLLGLEQVLVGAEQLLLAAVELAPLRVRVVGLEPLDELVHRLGRLLRRSPCAA
jgi:hypothetical protein